MSNHEIVATQMRNKFLDTRLTGFLSRKENSVSAMSTKTSSLYLGSRRASTETMDCESLPIESAHMTPKKPINDKALPTKLPKMQYLKSFYSTRSNSVASIDYVDKFIESQILPSPHVEQKQHPLSVKIHNRSASQKTMH